MKIAKVIKGLIKTQTVCLKTHTACLGLFVLASCGRNPVADTQTTYENTIVQDIPEYEKEEYYLKNWPSNPWSLFEDTEVPQDQVRLPHSMGALGDSITRAAVAHFNIDSIRDPWAWAFLLKANFYKMNHDGSLEGFDFPGLSWTTGLGVDVKRRKNSKGFPSYETVRLHKVNSHALRLSSLHGHFGKMPAFNHGVSGMDSSGMERKLADLMKDSMKNLGQPLPDYVTVLMGGNDVCAKDMSDITDLHTYYERMSKVLDTMLLSHPKTKILVASNPDFDKNREITKNVVMTNVYGKKLRCEEIWDVANVCKTINITEGSDRETIRRRVQEYNMVLEDFVESRRLIYGDRIRYSDTTKIEFTPDDFSLDCFHPNINGENKFAETTWQDSWWAK